MNDNLKQMALDKPMNLRLAEGLKWTNSLYALSFNAGIVFVQLLSLSRLKLICNLSGLQQMNPEKFPISTCDTKDVVLVPKCVL